MFVKSAAASAFALIVASLAFGQGEIQVGPFPGPVQQQLVDAVPALGAGRDAVTQPGPVRRVFTHGKTVLSDQGLRRCLDSSIVTK